MKIKETIPKFLIHLLFLMLLFLATDIVLEIPNNETHPIKVIEPWHYDEYSRDLINRIESFSENKDILFNVEFSGYAFIPTGRESPEKAIKLIFVSDDYRYEVMTEVVERFNLRDLFRTNGIIGINHGFVTKFSPLKMKNGIYKLYIYCFENGDAIGLVDSGKKFEKTYRSFVEIK